MGMGWQCMAFMLTSIPIRSYAGGYHAQTPARCYLFSILIVIVSLLGLKYMELDFWVFLFIKAVSSGIIFFVVPLESSNKPLSETELCIYRRRTRFGLVIVLVFMAVLYQFKPLISGSMFYAVAVLAILLIMGKIK